jgi:hypothetical protein
VLTHWRLSFWHSANLKSQRTDNQEITEVSSMEATSREFHPAANIFPMDDENIDALAEDIKEHGLIVPVELCDGKILDGRRRYMACRIADIEPKMVEVSPDDPVAYVLSLNLHRRHLSTTQLGMVAARAREFYDKAAKRRMSEGGTRHGEGVANLPPLDSSKARDAAGKAVGVSGRTVDDASRVLKTGIPELIEACDADKISVSHAARIAKESPERQAEIVPKVNGRPSRRVAGVVEEDEPEPGKSRGVGIRRANEAIDCLKRIPKNDGLRKRGFQIVTDWIKHNK